MIGLLIRRLLQAGVTLIGVTVAAFVFVKQFPTPFICDAKTHGCTPAAREAWWHASGYDLPRWQQYLRYLETWLHRDVPALSGLGTPFANTLYLAVSALGLEILLGVALGVLAAVRHRTWLDGLANLTSVVFIAVPTFVVAVAFLATFTYPWNWFGTFDFSGVFARVTVKPPPFPAGFTPVYWFRHIMLPSLALALAGIGSTAILTRAGLLEVLGSDYIVTARAKGLPGWLVVAKHGLKPALLPIVTMVGLNFGRIVAGDLLVEQIWHWPGIGVELVNDVIFRQQEQVIAIFVVLCGVFVVVSALLDIVYVVADPRIRLGPSERAPTANR